MASSCTLSRRPARALRRAGIRRDLRRPGQPRHRPVPAGVLRSAGPAAVHAALPERLLHRLRPHLRDAAAHPLHPRGPPEERLRRATRGRGAEPVRRLQPGRRPALLDAVGRPRALERPRHQRHRALARARFARRHRRRAQRKARPAVGRARPAVGTGKPVADRAACHRLHRRAALRGRRASPRGRRRQSPAAVPRVRGLPRRDLHDGRDLRVTPARDGVDLQDAAFRGHRQLRPPAGMGLHGRQHQEHHRADDPHP